MLGKLVGCKQYLKKWVRKNSCLVEVQIKNKEQELKDLQMQEGGAQMNEEVTIMEELNDLLAQEALKWQQRAKENWLKYGDRNSKFFHAAATQKNRRSRISVIKDKSSQPCKTKAEIEEAFVLYFQELFTGETRLEVDPCIQAVDKKVSESMNDSLLAEVTVEEIARALHQMPPLKGPARMGLAFVFINKTGV